MSKRSWTQEETKMLIKEFESFPELWNTSSAKYRDRHKKYDALDSMATSHGTTTLEIQRKLHNLRCQMNNEMRKIKRRQSQFGTTEISSSWEYFENLKFLINDKLSIEGDESMDGRDSGDDSISHVLDNTANTSDPLDSIVSKKEVIFTDMDDDAIQPIFFKYNAANGLNSSKTESKKSKKRKQEVARDVIVDEPLTNDDEYSIFGSLVVHKIRKLGDSRLRATAQNRIMNVLFELEMGAEKEES